MRLTGSEPHPGLLGSAQSSSVMQACQDVPCSGEVWPSGCSNLSSLCGTDVLETRVFQQTQSRLRVSSEATAPHLLVQDKRAEKGWCMSVLICSAH